MLKNNNSLLNISLGVGGLAYVISLERTARRLAVQLSPRQVTILMGGVWIVVFLYLAGLGLILLDKTYLLQKPIKRIYHGSSRRVAALKGVSFALLVLFVWVAVFTDLSRGTMQDPVFRFLILGPVLLLGGLFLPLPLSEKYGWRVLAAGVLLAVVLMLGFHLIKVVSYPFSMGWSEGNRLYDNSLVFGKLRYQFDGDLGLTYFAPGRYALWGIWFLIPNLPIAFHRLWDAFLWFGPLLVLGWVAARSFKPKTIRLLVALWLAIFLYQGPIYAPLALAAALMLALDRPSILLRALAVGLASYYLGLSRWTWAIAPGMWGVLIDLCEYYPKREGSWARKLLISLVVGLTGSLPGLSIHWRRFIPTKSSGSGTSLEFSQPLLWYRLFPNESYSTGIVLGITIATALVVLVLAWLLISCRWALSWQQASAVAVAVAGTLAVGLVISTKIGGGGDLHNLDMYFVTLVVLMMIYFDTQEFKWETWPLVFRVILVMAALIPVWNILRRGSSLGLPSPESSAQALAVIQTEVQAAAERGEILFMDQRQLLTFGYIRGVDLVPEYEKKYVMDQAMAGNWVYFEDFYQELRDKRFALIVSESLATRYKDRSYSFNEENNAWVKWVSEKMLCYYKPQITFKDVGVQLLVPREKDTVCP